MSFRCSDCDQTDTYPNIVRVLQPDRQSMLTHSIAHILALFFFVACDGFQKLPPIVILPGFGNDIIDYINPLGKGSDRGFVAALEKRGYTVSVVPIQRTSWLNIAKVRKYSPLLSCSFPIPLHPLTALPPSSLFLCLSFSHSIF